MKGLRLALSGLRAIAFALAALCAQAAWAQGSVALANKADGWNASLSYDALSDSGAILRDGDLVRFKLGHGLFILGSGEILRSAAITSSGGRLMIPETTAKALEAWFSRRDAERASRFSIAAILIDPGHGGRDPGAIGEHGSGAKKLRVAEKDVTLAVALDLKARLQALWPDKAILITRDGDTYPSLDERVDMGNSVKLGPNEAIIYVSIHANASFNKAASGYEVWYLNPDYRRTVLDASQAPHVEPGVLPILNSMLEEEFTMESVILAKGIMDGLGAAVGAFSPSRGIRAEEWFVVRNARMPSVLVELGFVTNEAEARLLSDPAHLRKLGEGIYNGIVSFVDHFERRKAAPGP